MCIIRIFMYIHRCVYTCESIYSIIVKMEEEEEEKKIIIKRVECENMGKNRENNNKRDIKCEWYRKCCRRDTRRMLTECEKRKEEIHIYLSTWKVETPEVLSIFSPGLYS